MACTTNCKSMPREETTEVRRWWRFFSLKWCLNFEVELVILGMGRWRWDQRTSLLGNGYWKGVGQRRYKVDRNEWWCHIGGVWGLGREVLLWTIFSCASLLYGPFGSMLLSLRDQVKFRGFSSHLWEWSRCALLRRRKFSMVILRVEECLVGYTEKGWAKSSTTI